MEKILEVKNLKKQFGDFIAVNDISFDVYKGEIFGFLGQNGAGKSTSINMITTMLDITSGEILLDGINVKKDATTIRKHIGIVFQQQTLDEVLSVRKNLEIHGKLYGMDKAYLDKQIEFVLKLVSLKEFEKKRVAALSGGQKRRVEIARGLLHNPKVLFLDEPTTGLDPQTRRDIWTYVVNLQQKTNMTIFLTTHYMDEAEICNRIAIMDHGKIVELDTPISLKEKLTSQRLQFTSKEAKIAKQIVDTYFKDNKCKIQGEKVEIEINGSVTKFTKKFLAKFKGQMEDLNIIRPTMDDVFLSSVSKHKKENEKIEKEDIKKEAKKRFSFKKKGKKDE